MILQKTKVPSAYSRYPVIKTAAGSVSLELVIGWISIQSDREECTSKPFLRRLQVEDSPKANFSVLRHRLAFHISMQKSD